MQAVFVAIKNGVVDYVKLCNTGEEMEELFSNEIKAHGVEPTDADFENGYFEHEDGDTFCMTWAETI